ncbi:cytochrome P450 [Artomyces pyxidatus]|uniref:Cytochrome P450 n=1 Tax=Artomyces pyxidatus TaxID=48021 RepID=A0ACB8SGM2_9AGAM|nr:cytochrome P450 [Artomyces pyxidatus]
MQSSSYYTVVSPELLLIAALSVSGLVLAWKYWSAGGNGRLPPGPSGNVASAFKGRAMVDVCRDWAKEYGPIFSFTMGTRKVVVLNDLKTTTDLLDKRGDIYSSRPRLIVAHEILSGGMRGLTMPYGEKWRKWRKIQHMGMNGRAALAYRDHQTLESTVVLRDLLADAGTHQTSLQRFATSVVLGICYGRRVKDLEDPMVRANYVAGMEYSRASLPGRYLVETWPILLWLPRPFQWFRAPLEKVREKDTNTYLTFLRTVKRRKDAGISKDCMAVYTLTDGRDHGLSEVEVAYALSAPFGAGIDSTMSTIMWTIICTLVNPEVMKKAQAEIDAVVGRYRLPTFQDEPGLPYVSAIIKEVTRFRPVAPLAVPHAVTRDDSYDGYVIPKGTTIWGNVEALTQDPMLFAAPEKFYPERFLGKDLDPRLVDFTMPFGFGRRMCPGMHVALQSVFIVVARILWAFDLVPASDGELPDVNAKAAIGLTRGPAPFKFGVRARHPDAVRIIEEEGAEADVRLKEWEY